MLKRVSILLVAFIYSFSVVGVAVSQHFCGGEPMAKTCGCGKSEKKSSCCTDKTVHMQVKQDQKASTFDFAFKKIEIPAQLNLLPSFSYVSNVFVAYVNALHGTHAPPLLKQKVGTYLFHCVFRL